MINNSWSVTANDMVPPGPNRQTKIHHIDPDNRRKCFFYALWTLFFMAFINVIKLWLHPEAIKIFPIYSTALNSIPHISPPAQHENIIHSTHPIHLHSITSHHISFQISNSFKYMEFNSISFTWMAFITKLCYFYMNGFNFHVISLSVWSTLG